METTIIKSIKDYNSCEYARQSYYERDTGYSEYTCDITNKYCDNGCPLCFEYSVTKKENKKRG